MIYLYTQIGLTNTKIDIFLNISTMYVHQVFRDMDCIGYKSYLFSKTEICCVHHVVNKNKTREFIKVKVVDDTYQETAKDLIIHKLLYEL